MWSPSAQRAVILIVIIVILLKLLFFANSRPKTRDLKLPDVFDAVVDANSLWVDEDEEKRFKFYKNIPAFAPASNKIAAMGMTKTAVCEMDTSIGQQVLCSLQQAKDEDAPCDSDSLQHYKDFSDLGKSEGLDKNFTDWQILFPRREPVERLVDHFMDTCVREARACFDCRLNLKCYLSIIHSVIKDLAKDPKMITEDHLKYVPQNWFCQMETMAQRFTFVDFALFANPTNPEYAHAKRPDNLRPEDIFEDKLSSHEKIHRYYTAFIRSRPDVLDLVKKIYYWDFLLLKMPIPELKVAETKDYKDGWH